jgi:hypothetical protein
MLKEDQNLKATDLLGKVLVQMKDGQDLYRVKIIDVKRNGRAFGYVPNYEIEIVRETDGKTAVMQSKMMFSKIEAGTVRFDKEFRNKGE